MILGLFGFVMSIVWISFTCDFVVDLLWIIGLILSIPKSLLGLTLLAVGNCLGDMNADVAMTKKGFGEMAVTGCLAGPVFNILFGLGISLTISLIDGKPAYFNWSLTDDNGDIIGASIVPLTLLFSISIVLIMVLFNGIVNKFFLVFKVHIISLIFYVVVIIGLCVYVGVSGVQ
jgi:Ca2+/Na+ antiporter